MLENSAIISWQELSLTAILLVLCFCEVYIFCIANIKLLEIEASSFLGYFFLTLRSGPSKGRKLLA